MKDIPSKPFSSGTEYEIFLYNYCEKCSRYLLREQDGFPAFPEDGGCRVLDAMERARFDIRLFPNKKIRQIEDNDGKVIKWHHCVDFAKDGAETDIPGQLSF